MGEQGARVAGDHTNKSERTVNPREIAGKYLREGRVMQLATAHGDQPRANSLYYVASDDLKSVYWLSEPERRHSRDIQDNPRVAGAIAIKTDLPVAGLQFEGDASEVLDSEEQQYAIEKYSAKYDGSVEGLYDRMVAGTNKHHLYKIAIRKLELFDEVNFPDSQVISIDL
jgi:uncharacterized protein YhbP (UPF0306 family)